MSKKAIKISVAKAPEEYDLGTSKFFGDPTIPQEWAERFDENMLFFAQIRLEEIAKYDKENRLPHKGYLYFFLDTSSYPYEVLVEHYDGEPDMVIEDFNEINPEFGHLTEPFLMNFSLCDEGESCTRLFGYPSGLDEDADEPLLLQFDPLCENMEFLSEVDGYAHIFFDTENDTLEGATDLYLEFNINRS